MCFKIMTSELRNKRGATVYSMANGRITGMYCQKVFVYRSLYCQTEIRRHVLYQNVVSQR